MAFYQTEARLDSMEIDTVGYDPESGEATVYLRRVVSVEDSLETVWIDHRINVSLELLQAMSATATALAEAMAEEGATEFDIRKPAELAV